MFSSRLPGRLEPNAFSRALDRIAGAASDTIDLTLSNPTRAGLCHSPEVFRPLSDPAVAVYAPEPFGMRSAREAVSDDYRRRGQTLPWDCIVLTSSTSDAYSLLFKLLCEPSGDVVLVPAPSYPLFEHLTALDGVGARTYRLEYQRQWHLDLTSVDEQWDARTKAVLAVSPNNPTGSVLSREEVDALDARAAARDAAVIVDEVFADYTLADAPRVSAPPRTPAALTFRLGGLSKSAAMPQVKLGWIAVEGPDRLVAKALERLEIICDTYLSVSTPVQIAAPRLIAAGARAREQVLVRIRGNHAHLREAVARHPSVELLHADGGWSAVLRIPSRETEEGIVLDLLEHVNVIVHPGFFFDFAHEAYLVVSLLPEPARFAEGIRRVLERVDG